MSSVTSGESSGGSSNASLTTASTVSSARPSLADTSATNKTNPGTGVTTTASTNTTGTNTNTNTPSGTGAATDANGATSGGTSNPPLQSSLPLTAANLASTGTSEDDKNFLMRRFVANQNPAVIKSMLGATSFSGSGQDGPEITYSTDSNGKPCFAINIGKVTQELYTFTRPDGSEVNVHFAPDKIESITIKGCDAIKDGWKPPELSGAPFPTKVRPDIRDWFTYKTPELPTTTTTKSSTATSSASQSPTKPFDIKSHTVPLGSSDSSSVGSTHVTQKTKEDIYKLLGSAKEKTRKMFDWPVPP